MTRVAVLAGGDYSPPRGDFDYYVGVDRGAITLLEKGFPLDLAVGDFDSITASEMKELKKAQPKFKQLNTDKDDTDTAAALKVIFEAFPKATVRLYGAFGGRLDHLLANVFLPSVPELYPYLEQLHLCDSCNQVSYVKNGHRQVTPVAGMDYVSFMADGEAKLTILGAKYELTTSNYFSRKIYASNEFIGQPITVIADRGYLVVIHSRDK